MISAVIRTSTRSISWDTITSEFITSFITSDNFATSYSTANNVTTLHSLVEAKGLSIHTGIMPREMVDGARLRNIVGVHDGGAAKGTEGTVVGEVLDICGEVGG